MNVPGTLATALSWATPSGVPYVIAAGEGHVTVGVAGVTAKVGALLARTGA